ncbi:MAG: hypothetical protein ACLGJB_26140 [Blastocatellia bacterium]
MALTKSALDLLLAYLDPDRDQAGTKYERIRLKLIKFFQWQGCHSPQDYADNAINVVARKLEEGEIIRDLPQYINGVARLLILEYFKERDRENKATEQLALSQTYLPEVEEKEARRLCMEQCLRALPYDHFSLITSYYRPGIKREERERLAEQMEIPLNAMRIRAHRIRQKLRQCLNECLGR